MISSELLKEYREIYRASFGRDISPEEALESGAKLLRMVEIAYRPMTKGQYGRLQKRRKETRDEEQPTINI